MFLHAELTKYEEPDHREDSNLDKATRGIDGIISVAHFVGIGSQYIKIARKLWNIRHIGLSALIFREELWDYLVKN